MEGECHICDGKIPPLAELAGKGSKLLREGGFSSFSISTSIPKDWLIQEEDIWDVDIRGARSVKDYLNRTLSALLEESAGLPYVAEGDCRIMFDMRSGNVSLERGNLHIFGRYEKLVPGISQSRWTCKSCGGKGCKKCGGKGKHYESIEEKIGEAAKKECGAGGYSLHASGREDVDALNTAGRPFVLSLRSPGNRKPNLEKLARAIGKSKEIAVKDLEIVPKGFSETVTESHFDKEYEAEAEFGRELTDKDIQEILSLSGKMLKQRTPTRVSHRRADLVRNRKVMEIEVLEHSENKATLRIKAEAGTYIKELISGDGGRTVPSIASLLQTEAKCTKLTVSGIDDEFLGLFRP